MVPPYQQFRQRKHILRYHIINIGPFLEPVKNNCEGADEPFGGNLELAVAGQQMCGRKFYIRPLQRSPCKVRARRLAIAAAPLTHPAPRGLPCTHQCQRLANRFQTTRFDIRAVQSAHAKIVRIDLFLGRLVLDGCRHGRIAIAVWTLLNPRRLPPGVEQDAAIKENDHGRCKFGLLAPVDETP